jgi:hypothetical protein
MDLEIHIPISPTDGFFNRVRYLVRSWQINGGGGLSYRFVVTVGADETPYDFSERVPWAKDQPISWRWFDRDLFRRHSWWGTINDRFRAEIEADYLLLMDADMLVTGPIAEALEYLPQSGGVAGVTAFETPFRDLPPGETVEGRWHALFSRVGLGAPSFDFRHSATGRICPAYYNNAFFLADRAAAAAVGRIIFDEMDACDRALGHMPFRDQVAMTMAICRLGLPVTSLPLRFNHFIGRSALPEWENEWQEARVIHYTATDLFSAETDGDSPQTVAQWLDRMQSAELCGIRGRFRDALSRVHEALCETRPADRPPCAPDR